jgi:hydrogenase maturation protease
MGEGFTTETRLGVGKGLPTYEGARHMGVGRQSLAARSGFEGMQGPLDVGKGLPTYEGARHMGVGRQSLAARDGSGEQKPVLSGYAMSPVRILGVGSPCGDDRIGWQAIDALESADITRDYPPDWVSLVRLDRPGARLLEAMAGAEAVILIDAMRSGEPPGTLRRLGMDQLEALASPLSSHGLGVAGALRLARSLGQLPARLVIIGVEIGGLWGGPEPLNDMQILEGALAGLITLVAQELERIHGERGD